VRAGNVAGRSDISSNNTALRAMMLSLA
jgi:hypothetical protein